MQQGTILNKIKELQKQREELIEAINESTQIAIVFDTRGLNKVLTKNKEIRIDGELNRNIIKCFQTNNREHFTNVKVAESCYLCDSSKC